MTMRDLALEGLEQALNQLIKLDPVAGGQLAGLVGMLVAVPVLAVGKIVLWPALRDALAAPRGPDDRPGAYA